MIDHISVAFLSKLPAKAGLVMLVKYKTSLLRYWPSTF